MTVLGILVLIYFIFNNTSIVNVFMLSIEKKINSLRNCRETLLPNIKTKKYGTDTVAYKASQLSLSDI